MYPVDEPVCSAEDGFAHFFRAEYPAVVRTVAVITHDQDLARDLAQEAFVQLLRHWTKVSTYDRPDAWVRRVAIRLATRTWRRDLLRTAKERQGFGGVTELAGPSSDRLDLVAAVRRLPARQRAVVALFYYEDRPVAEIADILDCTEATVKVHLHKARQRLALLLGAEIPHAH
jgi:RNA polymerase sigma-70 factor (sigma-E family)